jgi:hypothetical protein
MTYDYFFENLEAAFTQIWNLEESVSISCEQFTQIAEIVNPDDMYFVHKNQPVSSTPTLAFPNMSPHLSLTYNTKGGGETIVDVEVRRQLFDLILSFKSGKITFDELLNETKKQQC